MYGEKVIGVSPFGAWCANKIVGTQEHGDDEKSVRKGG